MHDPIAAQNVVPQLPAPSAPAQPWPVWFADGLEVSPPGEDGPAVRSPCPANPLPSLSEAEQDQVRRLNDRMVQDAERLDNGEPDAWPGTTGPTTLDPTEPADPTTEVPPPLALARVPTDDVAMPSVTSTATALVPLRPATLSLSPILQLLKERPTMLIDVLRTLPEHPHLAHADNPFPFHLSEGDSNVVVIVGENASGKSVLFKALSQTLRPHGITGITISIRERTGSADGGMQRAMMFGQEAQMSTGHVSVGVIERGFRNARNWAEQGNANVLMLDEPELGLSDGYAGALGEFLAQEAQTLNAPAHGLVVVTHSRALVQRLCLASAGRPHLIAMGERPLTLEQWWSTPEHRGIADLKALQERGQAARSTWNAVLKTVGRSPKPVVRRRAPGG